MQYTSTCGEYFAIVQDIIHVNADFVTGYHDRQQVRSGASCFVVYICERSHLLDVMD